MISSVEARALTDIFNWYRCPWWRHQMETIPALLAICAGNSPVSGEFPAQRPVTRSFDVFFDLRPNKRLRKQSCGWWFETLSRPLWRHCNVYQHWLLTNYNTRTVFMILRVSRNLLIWYIMLTMIYIYDHNIRRPRVTYLCVGKVNPNLMYC